MDFLMNGKIWVWFVKISVPFIYLKFYLNFLRDCPILQYEKYYINFNAAFYSNNLRVA